MRALIVEDNALVASGIKAGLELHGLSCDVAANAAAAQGLVASSRFDVCVLDLGLPDGDGLQLLAQWRARGVHMPVLILTARGSLDDKLAGFQAGTDDYLVKPFDLQELVVRLQALYRRAAGRSSDWLEWPGLRINPAAHEAWVDGRSVELSRREWALLEALLQAQGRVLSLSQLHDSLYGFEQEIGSNTVNVHVHNLRTKLGGEIVETVRGLGFRLGSAYCGGKP